jgi:hypothetical protein
VQEFIKFYTFHVPEQNLCCVSDGGNLEAAFIKGVFAWKMHFNWALKHFRCWLLDGGKLETAARDRNDSVKFLLHFY